MQYFSTNQRSEPVSFRDAVLNGQPDDNGLYFPETVPRFNAGFTSGLRHLSNADIAFQIIQPYVSKSIRDDDLEEICSDTVNFDIPVVEISDQISALELFHGPTLAFKDVGARFMSRCLKKFVGDSSQKAIVVVATSGDTGGAVSNGFHNVEGIEVVILYPKDKVSRIQELQLTTLGGNVTTLEVHGTFDDCQLLAKQALADSELRKQVFLTSANSINVARWLPQQFYYAFALKQWVGAPPVISVPSGNFGNLAAGMLINRSGLKIKQFIAACNANDTVPEYFRTGNYEPKPSVSTLSTAMDVGDPSNFVRILELFKDNSFEISEKLNAVSVTDEQTSEVMRSVFKEHSYILDPHGAVAFAALAVHLKDMSDQKGIFLETAHPVKFDCVETIIGNHIVIPNAIKKLESRKKLVLEIPANYEDVKEHILQLK